MQQLNNLAWLTQIIVLKIISNNNAAYNSLKAYFYGQKSYSKKAPLSFSFSLSLDCEFP